MKLKNKFLIWCVCVLALVCHMMYISPVYAWGSNRPLYARIKLANGVTFVDSPVDAWRFIGASECIEVIVNGRKYVTHASNILIYEK